MVNATSVSEKAAANEELTTALNNLNVIVENYPNLKAFWSSVKDKVLSYFN